MRSGPYIDMDIQTADSFVNALKKKLSKTSYAKPFNMHGPGILLVCMQSPWFDGYTCDLMREVCQKTDWSTNLGYFSRIFISFRSRNEQMFEEWILN